MVSVTFGNLEHGFDIERCFLEYSISVAFPRSGILFVEDAICHDYRSLDQTAVGILSIHACLS